jgi:tetratricopeptide (TPR) repeat protein
VTDAAEVIADWDRRIEAALWDDERSGSIEAAYDVFEEGAGVLDSLNTGSDKTEERDRLRVLSYALLRQANVLRQLGRVEEAALKDQEGLSVARRSGDPVSIGRTLLSMAGTAFASSDVERGQEYLAQARDVFATDSTSNAKQGLGWSWVLEADVGNAGLLDVGPHEVVAACQEALRLLEPIENWPGVARTYAAKAAALTQMGDEQGAKEALQHSAAAEARSA